MNAFPRTLPATVLALAIVAALAAEAAGVEGLAARAEPRPRRVLYNFDGSSCMYTKAGGKGPVSITAADVRRLIEEVAYEGSRVDTVLVCINFQVMLYPTTVGTMIGTPPSVAESQLTTNLRAFYDSGIDPYAVMLAETRRRGREALLSFRMNDDHGEPAHTTRFWVDHPDCQLGRRALNFGCDEVRAYVCALIEEAVRRYDSDGIELDFNRWPIFFEPEEPSAGRVAKMNVLVERVRGILDAVGRERGRPLVLAVRVPSNGGRTPPTPETAIEIGCDVPAWARNGWVDFVTVSEFLLERGDLPLALWKQAIPEVPVYGGIEAVWAGRPVGARWLTGDDYRRQAAGLVKLRADGIYIFNMFTSREKPPWNEPVFEVLRELGR